MAATSPEKLLEQLARGKAIGAVLLLGTDHYLREMCRNRIIETCVPEAARDWALARLSARDAGWDEILQRAETLPMLAPRQVIVVEDVESVEKLGEKSREEIIEALEKYLNFARAVYDPGARGLRARRPPEIPQTSRRESAGRRIDHRRRIGRGARDANGEGSRR